MGGSDTLDSILNSKIEFDTPQDGDTESGIVNIAGIAAGMENVSLRFKDSGGELLATETDTLTGKESYHSAIEQFYFDAADKPNWSCSFDTTAIDNGDYNIRAIVWDAPSNVVYQLINITVAN
jgi:hypothetical protein